MTGMIAQSLPARRKPGRGIIVKNHCRTLQVPARIEVCAGQNQQCVACRFRSRAYRRLWFGRAALRLLLWWWLWHGQRHAMYRRGQAHTQIQQFHRQIQLVSITCPMPLRECPLRCHAALPGEIECIGLPSIAQVKAVLARQVLRVYTFRAQCVYTLTRQIVKGGGYLGIVALAQQTKPGSGQQAPWRCHQHAQCR